MKTFDYRVANARTDARECYRCGERIALDELVIEGMFFPLDANFDDADDEAYFNGERSERFTQRYHLLCAVDVDVDAFLEAARRSKDPSPELDDARKLANARRKAIVSLARSRELGAAPVARTSADIEPARDRKGRPRVTVVVIGSASSSNSRSWNAVTELTHDYTITSPLREYVLDAYVGNVTAMVGRDPSQPLVAAVFAALDDVKIVKAQRDKLAALRALNAPTPLLWLIGPSTRDKVRRDAKILALREELARVGFAADEAPSLCAEVVDEAALRELALALDSANHETATPKTFTGALDNAVVAIEQALADDAREQFAPLVDSLATMISTSITRTPNAQRTLVASDISTRVRAAACAALREPAARERALVLLGYFEHREDAAAIDALLRSMLDEEGRTFHRSFATATAMLERWAPATLHRFAADAIIAPTTGKSRYWQLAPLLSSCDDLAIAALLRDFAKSAKKSDFRTSMAELRAVEIEARAAAAKRKRAASDDPAELDPEP
ncbi:MAG: hypothetical protein JNK05_35100 [Myxococcales bacterium]|nr:hypothetical protein [Myxococcales bacterium]